MVLELPHRVLPTGNRHLINVCYLGIEGCKNFKNVLSEILEEGSNGGAPKHWFLDPVFLRRMRYSEGPGNLDRGTSLELSVSGVRIGPPLTLTQV